MHKEILIAARERLALTPEQKTQVLAAIEILNHQFSATFTAHPVEQGMFDTVSILYKFINGRREVVDAFDEPGVPLETFAFETEVCTVETSTPFHVPEGLYQSLSPDQVAAFHDILVMLSTLPMHYMMVCHKLQKFGDIYQHHAGAIWVLQQIAKGLPVPAQSIQP